MASFQVGYCLLRYVCFSPAGSFRPFSNFAPRSALETFQSSQFRGRALRLTQLGFLSFITDLTTWSELAANV